MIKMNTTFIKKYRNITIILSIISIILANSLTYYMLNYTHYVYEINPITAYLHTFTIMYLISPIIEIIIITYCINKIYKINITNIYKILSFSIILITLYIDSLNDLYFYIHFMF